MTMTNEAIEQRIKELDEKHVQLEQAKRIWLAKADECTAEQLRLQGSVRELKKLLDDSKLPVMDSAPQE